MGSDKNSGSGWVAGRATLVASHEVSNAGLQLAQLVRTHPLPQGGTDLMGPGLVSKLSHYQDYKLKVLTRDSALIRGRLMSVPLCALQKSERCPVCLLKRFPASLCLSIVWKLCACDGGKRRSRVFRLFRSHPSSKFSGERAKYLSQEKRCSCLVLEPT